MGNWAEAVEQLKMIKDKPAKKKRGSGGLYDRVKSLEEMVKNASDKK